jgi:hypothetical protein
LKFSFSNHHFSSLNFFFGLDMLVPVSRSSGLWSLGILSKVLTLDRGKFAF